MLQFLIGLSILLLVIALIYWSERLIFGKSPKAAADHMKELSTWAGTSDVVGVFAVFVMAVALIPLLCFLLGRFVWRFVVLPLIRRFKRNPSGAQ